MNEYRHVCFKDLQNYYKKTDYFSGLTYEEKRLIRQNLEVASVDQLSSNQGGIVKGTYAQIKDIVDNSELSILCKYIVTDFQTIYKSNNGDIWGLDDHTSQQYSIVLTPISENKFSPNVSIIRNEQAMNWVVTYDFNSETLVSNSGESVTTKGKITYLQDQNNNSAYFDFKNIRFRKYLLNTDNSGLESSDYFDLYTFSKLTEEGVIEFSDDISIHNNKFDYDCYENVFLGTTNNNHFYGGFKQNLFIKDCTYNKFEWNTCNNKFKESISYTQGCLRNAVVNSTNANSAVSKEFKMVQNDISESPIFVVVLYDGLTLTSQVRPLSINN